MVLSSTKVSHEKHHEETHPHTCFLSFSSLHLFYGALGSSESPSHPLPTLFTNAIHGSGSVHGEECFVDIFLLCVFFLLSSRHTLSSVSVVFDFSASLNDVTPVSPISFPVEVMRNEK